MAKCVGYIINLLLLCIMLSFIIYGILTFSACFFHLFGTYYFLQVNHQPFLAIMITSILLNSMATVIRVPANMFLGRGLSVVYMEMLYVFLLYIATTLYSLFIRNENVPVHTYVIAGIIFGLFILNDYLSQTAAPIA